MSASQIPNLNSLRRGGLRDRNRGGFSGSRHKSKEEIIQNTDNDAAASRLSAVETGYLDDPFARVITTADIQRRLPLMNRGTYVRTTGIDRVVDTFISSSPTRKQIISLGAGSDTRYFRLKRKWKVLDLAYHEVDFRENNLSKIARIQSREFQEVVERLCNLDLSSAKIDNGDLYTDDYHLHAHDLRQLPPDLPWLDKTLPTLIVSECCLIYLSPEEADDVLSMFTKILQSAPVAIVIYEPIHPNDPFGKTMVRNLVSRGIYLQTLEKYADLAHQRERLRNLSFDARAADIDFIWREWVDQEEKDRIEKLEWMDEVEEFFLLAKHYCISWGWKNWSEESQWNSLTAPT